MPLHIQLQYFFARIDSYSYYITFVWWCNIALWDISLYLVELSTCVVIRHQTDMPSIPAAGLSIHTGLPILRLWYCLQRQISAGAKFHPSPPPRNSQTGRGRELAQDPISSRSKISPLTASETSPLTQIAVRMELVSEFGQYGPI